MEVQSRLARPWRLLAAILILGNAFVGVVSGQREAGAVRRSDSVDHAALLKASPADWLTPGRDYAETHYSPLRQIDSSNVGNLGLQWYWDIGSQGQLEAPPLVWNGTMYFSAPSSQVIALDARTGRLKWRWDPQVPPASKGGPNLCCGPVNRGLAIRGRKVYVGVLDGRLVALDADHGRVAWSVQTTPPGKDYSITGAPRVVRDKVIIGNAGADLGVRGFVTAYDAETGKQIWRFYTVPGNPADGFENEAMRRAAPTWTGQWWKTGGGGTVWDGMAYDPEADLLYVGTGNGSPWNRDNRSPAGGDNLYVSSILALRPNTGALAWHYQVTPGDDWDYAATQPLMLLDLTIDGRPRKVIVQAPKNGFFYVIDRITGQFISARPYVEVTWASGVDAKTGRPIEAPNARYGTTGGVWLSPGGGGARAWEAMSWNPSTRLVYVPGRHTVSFYAKDAAFTYRPGQINSGARRSPQSGEPSRPKQPAQIGFIVAWDPVAQKERWRVQFEEWFTGGTLSTAGNLVFAGSEDDDGTFFALDAQTGKKLWEARIGGGLAQPISYELDGRQYITVLSGRGWDQPARVWTYALGGTAKAPSSK